MWKQINDLITWKGLDLVYHAFFLLLSVVWDAFYVTNLAVWGEAIRAKAAWGYTLPKT